MRADTSFVTVHPNVSARQFNAARAAHFALVEIGSRVLFTRTPGGIQTFDTGVMFGPPNLRYDGAPRPITLPEAEAIAHDEYASRRGDRSWLVLGRGADGGMQ